VARDRRTNEEKAQAQRKKIEDELLKWMEVYFTNFKLIREKSKILQEYTAGVISEDQKLYNLWKKLEESTSRSRSQFGSRFMSPSAGSKR
jgi:hypothetical protein